MLLMGMSQRFYNKYFRIYHTAHVVQTLQINYAVINKINSENYAHLPAL